MHPPTQPDHTQAAATLTLPPCVCCFNVLMSACDCRFVLSTDKRLLHLKQYSHSPVTWFRNPMTHLVLVSQVVDVQ